MMGDNLLFAKKARGRVQIALLIVAISAAILPALIVVARLDGSRDAETHAVCSASELITVKDTKNMTRQLTLEYSGPPLTPEEIDAFEREIDGRLPNDYKKFMLAHNGGAPRPELGLSRNGELKELPLFSSLMPSTADYGLRKTLQYLQELNPVTTKGFVPIAGLMGGEDICLAVRGKVGAVFYTVFKYRVEDDGDEIPIDVTLEPLAGSFTEFLDSLTELPPPPYCRIEDLGRHGTPEDLEKYLAEGNSINAKGKNNWTIICEAICANNMPMIQACIKRGASLLGTIRSAGQYRHTHLIKMLVDAGVDINECDEYGCTLLHNINSSTLPGITDEKKDRELRDAIIKLGAIDPLNRIEELGERGTADDLARHLAEGHSIDAKDMYGLTIICSAIKFNNVPMIRACIERGASLSETIHATVHHFRPELIEMLVKAGADVNEMDSMATPLLSPRWV